mgnify:CR=1 FL=1
MLCKSEPTKSEKAKGAALAVAGLAAEKAVEAKVKTEKDVVPTLVEKAEEARDVIVEKLEEAATLLRRTSRQRRRRSPTRPPTSAKPSPRRPALRRPPPSPRSPPSPTPPRTLVTTHSRRGRRLPRRQTRTPRAS